MSRDVFLSYASADKSTADRLSNLLEAAGVSCWIAPRDILPSADWPSEIHRGISACQVFVLIASAELVPLPPRGTGTSASGQRR